MTKDKSGRKSRKGRNLLPILGLLLILVGALVFFYPTLSGWLSARNQVHLTETYDNSVKHLQKRDLSAEWEKARIYNENLAGDPLHDPFVLGSGYALPDNYMECLNINGDSVMGYVEIPKIGCKLSIRHGTDTDALEKGVGHIEQTFLPIGGKGSHAILTGHRGLPDAELFTRLDELEKGDIFLIHVLDETHAYKVDDIKVINPDEINDVYIVDKNHDWVTLCTCTPYGINTKRLLVRGERTAYTPKMQNQAGKADYDKLSYRGDPRFREWGIFIGLAVVLLIVILHCIRKLAGRSQQRKGRGNDDSR